MLNVYFTIDVEVWCSGWQDIDAKFPNAFKSYVHGTTQRGDFGLPFQLRVLSDHGLTSVCFIEPLFSARFGSAPLQEIVGLVQEAGHEAQLHMHTEWVDEAQQPLLDNVQGKRQHLLYFSLPEQQKLIATGLRMLEQAGATQVNAFRAGSFGFNRDTLRALAVNGIAFDSSYNALYFGLDSGVMPGVTVVEPVECEGVCEVPMTVFKDGLGALRHAQLTACSSQEMERLLWQALEQGRSNFVILSHNFELLNPAKTAPDAVVIGRLRRLCAFLERHRDVFRVRGFRDLPRQSVPQQPAPLTTPLWATGIRLAEQAYRRRYQ